MFRNSPTDRDCCLIVKHLYLSPFFFLFCQVLICIVPPTASSVYKIHSRSRKLYTFFYLKNELISKNAIAPEQFSFTNFKFPSKWMNVVAMGAHAKKCEKCILMPFSRLFLPENYISCSDLTKIKPRLRRRHSYERIKHTHFNEIAANLIWPFSYFCFFFSLAHKILYEFVVVI